MNKCPHPDCTNMKAREMYACRSHWFQLPKRLRDKINRGYQNSASEWLTADKEASEYWAAQKEPKKEGA